MYVVKIQDSRNPDICGYYNEDIIQSLVDRSQASEMTLEEAISVANQFNTFRYGNIQYNAFIESV